MTEKERIVENGYDKIAERHHTQLHVFDNRKEVGEFVGLLPKNAKVAVAPEFLLQNFWSKTDLMPRESIFRRVCLNLQEKMFQKLNSSRRI